MIRSFEEKINSKDENDNLLILLKQGFSRQHISNKKN